MASSLTPSNFTIKITEERVVRNNVIKHEILYTIPNITNVDHRILTCPENIPTDLIKITSPNPGAGTFVSSSIEYVRITNLDTETPASIILSGSDSGFALEIKPKSTIILSGPNVNFNTNSGLYVDPNYVDPNYVPSVFDGVLDSTIKTIQVYPISSSIDVEYTIVNS
jgi:hypothetical protein